MNLLILHSMKFPSAPLIIRTSLPTKFQVYIQLYALISRADKEITFLISEVLRISETECAVLV